MSDALSKLPMGYRHNNPGNLRERMGDRGVVSVDKNFAVYRTMLDGVIALAEELHIYYTHHDCKTIRAFIQRYAPALENDVLAYENHMAKWMRVDPKEIGTKDIRLDLAWHSIDMMRGIVAMELGAPPAEYSIGGEWIGPDTYIAAMRLVGN